MSNLFQRIESIWDGLKAGKAKTRAHFKVNRDHVDKGAQLGPRFKAKEHYFQVVLNELFLASDRLWYIDYDPMAFVATTYTYGTAEETLPLVVGPSLLQSYGQQQPAGMIFENTAVSGMHPYQGGPFTLVIILSRLQRQNNMDKLLRVVESISGAIDPSTAFTLYLKIARSVLDGFETMLGFQETMPIVGYRTTINPDIGQAFEPGYYVLINADAEQIKQNLFWVKDSHLYHGSSLETAHPYRENDFILFSIAQAEKRSDENRLPFYPVWKATSDLAQLKGEHFWNEAKAQFNTLKRQIYSSPDLTSPNAQSLLTMYFEELKRLHHETALEDTLAPKTLSSAEIQLQNIADELDKLD